MISLKEILRVKNRTSLLRNCPKLKPQGLSLKSCKIECVGNRFQGIHNTGWAEVGLQLLVLKTQSLFLYYYSLIIVLFSI